MWSRLSLLPRLQIDAVSGSSKPDISISLRHCQSQPTKKAGSRTRSLDKTDLIPPRDVCRAELNSIQLELDFLRIHEPKQAEKASKKVSQDKSPEIRLVERAQAKQTTDHVAELESAVRRINSVSLSITMNFGELGPDLTEGGVTIAKEISSGLSMELRDTDTPTSSSEVKQTVSKSKPNFFPKQTRRILTTWLESHTDHPFPTAVEKQELMVLTGLTKGHPLPETLPYAY
jgi:hypothetical protein